MLHADWLARRAAYHPGRTALHDPAFGESVSYGALHQRAGGGASALAALGVQVGDRVAVLAGNRIEQIELFFACARLGALLVPLNWRLAAPELAHILADCTPSVLLVEDEQLPALAALRALDAWSGPTLGFESELDGASWASRRDSAALAALAAPGHAAPVREESGAMLLYTSGSTGRPKGAILTHGSLTWNLVNTRVGWGLGEREVTITHTPLFHTGGWNVLTLPLLHGGGTALITRGFDPDQTLDLVAEHGVTVLFAVPTMFADLLAAQQQSPRDLSSLRVTISGGAACPRPLIEAFCALGAPLKQGYGLTEVGPNCFVFPDGHEVERAGTVGLPMPHLQMRLVDTDGAEVPIGAVGELQLRGPTVCGGYWNAPQATAAALSPDGWFATGDLFTRDAQGWYSVVGRRKEMFISGGENIYPAEVERVLYTLPGVLEAAVVPQPDARWGEVGHAFLAFAPAAPPSSQDEVRALCRTQLAGYKVPKRVTVLPALPKGPTGKIARAALVALCDPRG